jgi:hypothetical protein
MLGNWGKVNGEWMAHDNATLRRHIKDLLPLASERAGGIAWEYFFYFDGGRPPWTSALSQGTAVQALARAAKRLHWPQLRAIARRGLAIFHKREPVGVRLPAARGPRYLIYSFSTHQLVLNAFVQSLVGLYDYSNLTKSKEGWALFHAAEPQARVDTPLYDTGAWSLYSMGGPESDLSYHVLLRDFLHNLCRRTHRDAYCTAEDHFTSYLHRAPKPRIITTQVRAGETYYVRFAVDKVSSVSLAVSRDGRVARSFAGTISRGRHFILWSVPRSGAGTYSVRLAATDLAGNSASTRGTITALKPHKRPAH